jgi:hypothetical protein
MRDTVARGLITKDGSMTNRRDFLRNAAYVRGDLAITLRNCRIEPCELVLAANAYSPGERHTIVVPGQAARVRHWPLERSARWYDITWPPGRRFTG